MLLGRIRLQINFIFYILENLEEIFLYFKNIHRNGYHIEIMDKCNIKYFYITSIFMTKNIY